MMKKRGAQKGNQNAVKPGRKQYVQVFGQRWPVEVGEKIKAYLERHGKSQKQFLSEVVEEKITTENADA
jgi:predicted DNA-binding protein